MLSSVSRCTATIVSRQSSMNSINSTTSSSVKSKQNPTGWMKTNPVFFIRALYFPIIASISAPLFIGDVPLFVGSHRLCCNDDLVEQGATDSHTSILCLQGKGK